MAGLYLHPLMFTQINTSKYLKGALRVVSEEPTFYFMKILLIIWFPADYPL